MDNKVVIIKVKHPEILKYLTESYNEKKMCFYYPKLAVLAKNLNFLVNKKGNRLTVKYCLLNKIVANSLLKNKLFDKIKCFQELKNRVAERVLELKPANFCLSDSDDFLYFFAVSTYDNKKELFAGKLFADIKKGRDKYKIKYQIMLKYSFANDRTIIENFEKLQYLEETDFDGYMICCENADLVKQFRYLIEKKKEESGIDYLYHAENRNDEDEYDEDGKNDCKQENAGENRFGKNFLAQNDTVDLKQKEDFCERAFDASKRINKLNRTDFQRDYERIVHAKAFRRLVDKAQIFTSSKGDHYRTRMTHTMEVVQIAKGIARELDLNIELTEAIALAHDIGHTPFGHQGERTLDDILNGKIGAIETRNSEDNFYGGFKHNLQGVKVVTLLEEKYFEHEGINLSYQVLEGILKHTKLLSCRHCGEGRNCSGSRGQCSKLQNDLEGFLPDQFDREKLFLGYNFPTTLEGQVVAVADEIAQRSHDIDDAFRSSIISFKDFKNYLSLDKFKELKKRIEGIENVFREKQESILFVNEDDVLHGRIVSEIITFFIEQLCAQSCSSIKEYKEAPIKRSFFEEHKRVDEQLIKFDDNTAKLCKYLEDVISKKVLASSEVACFDDKAGMIVRKLFKAYYDQPLLLPQTVLRRIYKETIKKYDNAVNFTVSNVETVREELGKTSNPFKLDSAEKQSEYFGKQKILVRTIVDYIAGMTDSYAVNEYNRIYKP